MRLTGLNERPSAFTAACAPAHAHRVGRVAVVSLPGDRWRLAGQPVASSTEVTQHKSVQLQQYVQLNDALVRFEGTDGRTTKAIRMATSPIMPGVKASGVPPRGRPV